jgi:hypothetical protein
MFVVVSKKRHVSGQVPMIGLCWSHTSAETAVAHAEARARLENEAYVVTYEGRKIYTTER